MERIKKHDEEREMGNGRFDRPNHGAVLLDTLGDGNVVCLAGWRERSLRDLKGIDPLPVFNDYWNNDAPEIIADARSNVGARLIFNLMFQVDGQKTVVEPLTICGHQIAWNAYIRN